MADIDFIEQGRVITFDSDADWQDFNRWLYANERIVLSCAKDRDGDEYSTAHDFMDSLTHELYEVHYSPDPVLAGTRISIHIPTWLGNLYERGTPCDDDGGTPCYLSQPVLTVVV